LIIARPTPIIAAGAMDTSELLPPLLKPLLGECLVVEGGPAAASALTAIRGALGLVDGFRTLRVRPGRAIFEVKTGARQARGELPGAGARERRGRV
jgi:hypothetical protein